MKGYRKIIRDDMERAFNGVDALVARLKEIQGDIERSEIGKQNAMKNERADSGRYPRQIIQAMKYAGLAVRECIAEQEKAKKADASKAREAGHQVQLSNVVKTLETCAGDMSKDDIRALVEPVAFDASAKWLIEAAIQRSGKTTFGGAWCKELFARHAAREETIARLQQLNDMVEGYWGAASAQEDLGCFSNQLKAANMKDLLNSFDADMTMYDPDNAGR